MHSDIGRPCRGHILFLCWFCRSSVNVTLRDHCWVKSICNVFFVMNLCSFCEQRDLLPNAEIIPQVISHLNIASLSVLALVLYNLCILTRKTNLVEKLLYLVLGAMGTRNITYPTAIFFHIVRWRIRLRF